jgi:hypothetical protein
MVFILKLILFTCFLAFFARASSEPTSWDKMNVYDSSYFSLKGMTFSSGVYAESFLGRTASQFSKSALGYSISFEETVTPRWSGGLRLRWSEWTQKEEPQDPSVPEKIGVLTLLSEVLFQIKFSEISKEERLASLKALFSFGLGAALLTPGRVLTTRKAFGERGESIGQLGFALRYDLSSTVALSAYAQIWKGFNTENLSSFVYGVEVNIGDIQSY